MVVHRGCRVATHEPGLRRPCRGCCRDVFANKVGQYTAITLSLIENQRTPPLRGPTGQVFFSSPTSRPAFRLQEALDKVTIDLNRAHFLI